MDISTFEEKIPRFRNDQLLTRLEDLSNDVLYDIFDYLNGCDLYQSFSSLNHRFDQLRNSSSRRLIVEFDSTSSESFEHFHKIFYQLNVYQIFSFNFHSKISSNRWFSSFNFKSSMIHLESIDIELTNSLILMSILKQLFSLPRLFSLKIRIWDEFKDLKNIFQLIFALPVLKLIRFTVSGNNKSMIFPMDINEQRSSIEDLGIDPSCTFSELAGLVSYTPNLRRLKFFNTNSDDTLTEPILPMILPNLTNLCMTIYDLTFDRLEILMKNILCTLKAFYLRTICQDINYFDAYRWEQWISENLPYLERLTFNYHIYVDNDDVPKQYLGQRNQFTSLFWIQRQWIFQVEIDSEEIIYSIQPYSKRWYEYSQSEWIYSSSSQLSQSTRLTITDDDNENQLLFLKIDSILTMIDIYHLDIANESISMDIVINIINSLPKLITLKIHCLVLSKPMSLYVDEIKISNTNEIRKVLLKTINDLEEAYLLIKLCPRINYFQLDSINSINAQLFFSSIINEVHNHLRYLCCRVPAADDQLLEQFSKIFHSQKISLNYKLWRTAEYIYFQWK